MISVVLRRMGAGLVACAVLAAFVLACSVSHAAESKEQEFKDRIVEATKGLSDLSMVATIVEKNKHAMEKVDQSYSRLYDFNSAKISIKLPGKMRIEGKLGMVKFEYIINPPMKILRAPAVRFRSKDDYSDDPAKLQRPFDMGLITPSLWDTRRLEIVDDPEASAAGEIKMKLFWPKGDMKYVAWVDSRNLWLKRFEKRDSKDSLMVRAVYSSPKHLVGGAWMPSRVEVYAPSGEKAGATELSDIKVNAGLADSLFE